MRIRAGIIAAVAMQATSSLLAQGTTDIHVAELSVRGDRVEVGEPVNVTARAGYDNQPWFLPDGSGFLYVSQRDGQTDVWRYELGTGRSVQVTRTAENEYSPTLPPGGERLLVVRWAADMSTGAVWWYTAEGEPVEEAVGSVARTGYYAVVDERTLALFINDSIQSFMVADMQTGDTVRVGEAMGGSGPRTVPGERAVSFLRQDDGGAWWLTRLDLDTRAATPLVPMLEGVANYTWLDGSTVLAGRGGTIYRWRRGGAGDWAAVAEFTDPALQGITRIAVSPAGDRVAFVSAVPEARVP